MQIRRPNYAHSSSPWGKHFVYQSSVHPLNPEPRTLNPSRRRIRRSGVVLLIVVSLLALFVLLGVTYTLAVSQYHQASKLELQVERVGDRPDSETDIVLGQILFDTQARSVLQYQSLLRDLYGYDGNVVTNTSTTVTGCYPQFRESIQGTVTDISTSPNGLSAGNQLFTFTFNLPLPNPIPATAVPLTALSPLSNYYAGRVITFQSGPCANHSARIVAYTPSGRVVPDLTSSAPAIGQITIEMIESKLAGTVSPTVGSQFVINGTPFNGAGMGYSTASGNIDAVYRQPDPVNGGNYLATTTNTALQPNIAAYDPSGVLSHNIDLGGLDEPWDAVDLQNPFLAMIHPRAAENPANTAYPIIPSFHRPELVNYWYNGAPADRLLNNGQPLAYLYSSKATEHKAARAQRDFLRTFVFRPMPWDHPNFTGSNANFAPTWDTQANGGGLLNSPQLLANLINQNNSLMWDVDNDSDGIPDSIWIDPGLPVITTPEGRRYKRLAAILIKDLDGSLNLNAHGNLAQVADARYRAEYQPQPGMLPAPGFPNTPAYTAPPSTIPGIANVLGLTPNLAAINPNYFVPRGMGFGPAEVDFLKIFTNTTPAASDANAVQAYTNLMRLRYSSKVVSSGPTFDDGSTASPGTASPNSSTYAYDYRDPLAAVKHAGIPNDYANTNLNGIGFAQWNAQPSWYASPPDVWGRGAVVLDVGGQPLFAYMGQPPIASVSNGEAADSPYEMCLSGENNNADSPFTVAELERLLRYHDVDSPQLPPRLLLAATAGGTQYLSSELPGVIGPSHHRRNMVTTHSSDISVPATSIPPELRTSLATYLPVSVTPAIPKIPGNTSILDLYAARLMAGNVTLAQIPYEMQKVVPSEFFKGQKFDINRTFGDGIDNNGDVDGMRDDPYEAILPTVPAWQGGTATTLPNLPATFQSSVTPIYPQYTNGVSYNTTTTPARSFISDNLQARQLYARHLFCLAMLFLPPNIGNPTLPSSFPPTGFSGDAVANNQLKYQQLIVRRIAQWAVNCVDYRDQDRVMTPFEFDYNPWNGWQVDGNLATDGSAAAPELIYSAASGTFVTAPPTTERGLVWGMESPEVVISETLAFHDRGLKDTDQAGAGDTKVPPAASATDMNLDQLRVPKGSMFVELYSPRSTQWATAGETGNMKPQNTGNINLAQLAPLDNGGYRRPVWRLAFSRLTKNDPNNPATAVFTNPESTSVEETSFNSSKWTANVNVVPGSATPLTIDRFAYFVNALPSTNGNVKILPPSDLSASFWWNSGGASFSLPLQPGQYAVVAPRPLTYLGSQNSGPGGTPATPAPPPGSLWGGNSQQYIQAAPGSVVVTDTVGTQTSRTYSGANADARFPLGIVCDVPNPLYTTGDTDAWNVGLNISEPLPALDSGAGTLVPSGLYYPSGSGVTFKPSDPSTTKLSVGLGPRATNADFYDDPDAPAKLFKTTPLEASGGNTNYPLVRETMQSSATYTDCSCVLLQRLANPNLPFNPPQYDVNGNLDASHDPNTKDAFNNVIINPYITVDWQTTDLTVFNGEEDMKNPNFNEIYYNKPTAPQPLAFRSRQRGYLSQGSTPINGTTLKSNPWPPLSRNDGSVAGWETPVQSLTGGSSTYFDAKLSNALTVASGANTYTVDVTNNKHSLGSLNSTIDFPISSATTPIYFGEPSIPFPWINWNNRPFTNALELLAVPAASPGRFFLEMTPGFPPPLTSPAPPPAAPPSPYTDLTLHLPFGNMLNFFQSAQISTPGNSPHLYRLLDFVEVPSPFSGAERWYNPQNFGSLNTMTGEYSGVGFYRPPFNKLSRFRDPGRVNVNTIFDTEVWDSVVGQFPGLRTADYSSGANQVFLSRQGDGGTTVYAMNSSLPTRFANPIRTADCSDLMPNVGTMRKQFPVQGTLLREDSSTSPQQPLLRVNSNNNQYYNWIGSPSEAPNAALVGQYHDVSRNPYFAYQTYQKLGSVLTNRSNCFAIWVTIGYFEVEDNTQTPKIDSAHPDGLSLAQEVGADSGQVTRHRAFYIIDRSIPVGFIPGSKLNTDDCVLVRRLIE